MKRNKSTSFNWLIFSLLIFIFLKPFSSSAQFNYQDFDSTSAIRAQFGVLQIGDQQFVGGRLTPEIHFGKFGFGLDIPIFFDISGKSNGIRTEEYNKGVGSARLLNYVRYGVKKRDKVFARYGMIDRTNIGFGYLVNNYTNAASFERRKVGVSWDVRFLKVLGVEGIYTDFNGFNNLFSIRPYVRPLAFLEDNPLLKSIEVGWTYVSDADQKYFNIKGEEQKTKLVSSGLSAWGLDAGVNFVNNNKFTMSAFVSYGQMDKIQNLADSVQRYRDSSAVNPSKYPLTEALANGYKASKGFNIGTQMRIDAIADQLQFDIRLERLFQEQNYMPQFFDANYEIDKDSKLWLLANAPAIQGTYGAMSALIAKRLRITGGIQIPDKVTDQTPAMIHMNVSANEILPKVILQGNYVKGRLGNLADAFVLDSRSLLTARAGYKIASFLEIGVNYRWTFARVIIDGQDRFEATSYVMPYFGLNFNLAKKAATGE